MSQRKEEYITNKVLAVFSLCLGGVLVLMGVKNLVSNGVSYLAGMMLVRILIGVSAVGVLAGLFMIIREKKNRINTSLRILTGRNVFLVFFISLVIFTLIYRYLFPVFTVFYGVLPALAIYYLIYHSYQPEFFVIAADGGLAIVLLLIVRRALVSSNVKYFAWVALGVMAAIMIVQIAVAAGVKAKNGVLKLGNKSYEFNFSGNAYTMMFVTPIIMTAVVAVGAFMGANISFYGIFVVAAYLFVTAVYYTVKLM